MDELEISKTLKPLTPKRAAEWFIHQKKEMGKNAVSVYLFIAQDGLRQANLTFQHYCEEIGIDERTARYWISRVKATMIVKDITDISLLDQYELREFNTALVPTAAAAEILRLPAAQAKEAWQEWSAIRDEPTLATKGNAASFRRIAERKFPRAESETVSDSQDQKQPKTAKTAPVETAPNTVNAGPWCGACGDVCKAGEMLCDDCIADAVSADPMPEGEPAPRLVAVIENDDPFVESEDEKSLPRPLAPISPMKSIAVLTVCSAVNHKSKFYLTLHLTDGNGKEYTAVLHQKVLDLAQVK